MRISDSDLLKRFLSNRGVRFRFRGRCVTLAAFAPLLAYVRNSADVADAMRKRNGVDSDVDVQSVVENYICNTLIRCGDVSYDALQQYAYTVSAEEVASVLVAGAEAATDDEVAEAMRASCDDSDALSAFSDADADDDGF